LLRRAERHFTLDAMRKPFSRLALFSSIGQSLVLALALSSTAPAWAQDRPAEPPEATASIAQALQSVILIGPSRSGTPSGSGAGFVFTSQGDVLTNAHVLGEASTVRATLFDGRVVEAVVVGVDARTDIAVVRLPPDVAVPPLALANADRLNAPGLPVYALGHPMGFEFSVTSGVIAGEGRFYDANTPVAFLQHDAALNPGSSGGPLIDAAGVVLGMNTATPPQTLFDIGIALAIPAPLAGSIARALIADGAIQRGALGLRVSHADTMVAAALGAGDQGGALIDAVESGGASDRAGLQAGDLILAIDGQGVSLPRDVLARTMTHGPGDRVRLDFVRSGARRSAIVTLQRDLPPVAAHVEPTSKGNDLPDLGMLFDLSVEGRVMVTDVVLGSLAQTYGIGPGDRIQAVNGVTVDNAELARNLLAQATGPLVVLRVERTGLGVRHINLPRTFLDGTLRSPGLPTEQPSQPL